MGVAGSPWLESHYKPAVPTIRFQILEHKTTGRRDDIEYMLLRCAWLPIAYQVAYKNFISDSKEC